MGCQNEKCATGEAQVLLTRNVARPTWFCGYCAAAFLASTDSKSFVPHSPHSYDRKPKEVK